MCKRFVLHFSYNHLGGVGYTYLRPFHNDCSCGGINEPLTNTCLKFRIWGDKNFSCIDHFLQFNFTGYLRIYIKKGGIFFGKNEVSLTCWEKGFSGFWSRYKADNKDLVLDFRQNDKSEWTSIGRSNKSMSYIVQNTSGEGIIRKIEMQNNNDCKNSKKHCSHEARFSIQIEYDECLSDKNMPTFRCRILSRNETLDISREIRLPLKGEKTKWASLRFLRKTVTCIIYRDIERIEKGLETPTLVWIFPTKKYRVV